MTARYLAVVVCSVLTAIVLAGCATSQTLPGATMTQKLHDDEKAFSQVEVDVKAACGDKFAPIATVAAAIVGVATAVGDIAAYNFMGAVQAAAASLPAIIADVQGLTCVAGVLKSDYAKFKPAVAAKP